MTVVLFILKIIGILLLVLLGLFLCILLGVLFIPARYVIRGNTDPEMAFSVTVSWLLHLIHIRFVYRKEKNTLILRILGIPISPGKKNRSTGKKKKPENPHTEDTVIPGADETVDLQMTEAGKDDFPETEECAKAKEDVKTKGRFRNRRRFSKIRTLPGMIRDKLVKLRETVRRVRDEIKSESNRHVAALFFRELKYLLKHFLPGRGKADVQFGMEDPSVTGWILAIFSQFPIMFQPKVHIVPDFMSDKNYIKGSFVLKGHVRTVHAVAVLIRLWRQEEVKTLLKRVKN